MLAVEHVFGCCAFAQEVGLGLLVGCRLLFVDCRLLDLGGCRLTIAYWFANSRRLIVECRASTAGCR